jgi:hypothetical protein
MKHKKGSLFARISGCSAISQALAFIVLGTFLLSLSSCALISTGSDGYPSNKETHRVIQNVAKYTCSGLLTADNLLKRFPSFQQQIAEIEETQWGVLPDYQKLRIAAQMAQNASPQSAEWYLATMSKALAQQYNSILQEGWARPYLKLDTPDPTEIVFRLPEKVSGHPIDLDTKTIAAYYEGGIPRPAYLVLQQDFGLTEDDAIDLLIKHRSFEETIESQLSLLPIDKRQAWYDQQYEQLTEFYGSHVNEERVVRNLIIQLSSEDEKDRINAARKLSSLGKKLSESQIKQIERIMIKGEQSWSEFLYRESHCSWYEKTTIKYYAATALENMESPYVSRQLASEAEQVKAHEKERVRVVDAGWI